MTLPLRSDPTRVPGERIFIFVDEKGLEDPTWPTEPTMQVQNAESNPSTSSDSWRTLGSDEQEADTIEHAVTIQIYPDTAMQDAAKFMGMTPPPGGWDGAQKIEFDPTRPINVKAEHYDKDENLVNTEIWQRVKWRSMRRAKDAEGFWTWNFDGRAKLTYDLPGSAAAP